MSDSSTETLDSEATTSADSAAPSSAEAPGVASINFKERYGEIISKLNQTLNQVDWSQMGRIGKASGVILVVIVAQILIKGVLDTINLLPVVPGLLELLGLIVVGQWSWKNLTTAEKRNAVETRIQTMRQEYLG
jgi:hypothetical protein